MTWVLRVDLLGGLCDLGQPVVPLWVQLSKMFPEASPDFVLHVTRVA